MTGQPKSAGVNGGFLLAVLLLLGVSMNLLTRSVLRLAADVQQLLNPPDKAPTTMAVQDAELVDDESEGDGDETS